MNIGDKVRIINTDSIWDNKEGTIEYLDEYTVTVYVEFNKEEQKYTLQDFDIDNVELID